MLSDKDSLMTIDRTIYILLSSAETLYQVSTKSLTRHGTSVDVSAGLYHKIRRFLPELQRKEQIQYINTAAEAAYASLNKLDLQQSFHAEVYLKASNDTAISFEPNSSSAGLGYALALALEWRNQLGKSNDFNCEVFATGEIHNSGTVTAIGHLATKIDAACNLMAKQQSETGCKKPFIVFYPKANQDSITSEIQQCVAELGGELSPVTRLQTALVTLLGDSYDGDPEGRWSPFKGLSSFDYADKRRFFGRERAINQLLQSYNDVEGGFLVITGVSGSGKSSAVKAGLIPAIEKQLTDQDSFHWIVTSPKLHNSINELLNHLFKLIVQAWSLGDTAEKLTELALSSPEKLFQRLNEVQSKTENNTNHLFWFIDQYEDIFSHSLIQKERAKSLAPLLERLSKNVSGLNIIISIRREYLETFGRYGIDINVPHKLYPDEWAAIVEKQAKCSGLRYEDGLDTRIINDANDVVHALPVVEYLLEQLYIKATEENESARELKHHDYEALGGVQGVIAYRAEDSINRYPHLTNEFFDYFIGLNSEELPFARSVEVEPIRKSNPELYKLIQSFIDTQLVIDCGNESITAIKLAHDSLFFQWDRLKQWLKDNKEYLQWRQQIEGQFNQWRKDKNQSKNKSGHFLLKNKWLLKQAERYLNEENIFQNDMVIYIHKSIKSHRSSKIRTAIILVLIPILISIWHVEIQNLLGIIKKDLSNIKETTKNIEATTDFIAKKTSNIEKIGLKTQEVVINLEKSLQLLSQTGGIVLNPISPAEIYHNARLLSQRGEVDESLLLYRKLLSFNLPYVDPVRDFISVIRLKYGTEGAKKAFELFFAKVSPELRDYGRLLLTIESIDIVNLLLEIENKHYEYPPLDIIYLDKYMSLPWDFKPFSLTAIAQDKLHNFKKALEDGSLSMFFIDKIFLNTSIARVNSYSSELSNLYVPVDNPLVMMNEVFGRHDGKGKLRVWPSWNGKKNILQSPPSMKVKFINVGGVYKNIWSEMFDLDAIKLEEMKRNPTRKRNFESEKEAISKQQLIRHFIFATPNIEKFFVQVAYTELGGTNKSFCLELKPITTRKVNYRPLSDCTKPISKNEQTRLNRQEITTNIANSLRRLSQKGSMVLAPENPVEIYHNARLLSQQGDIDKSFALYKKLIRLNFLYADPFHEIIDLLRLKYDSVEAKNTFKLLFATALPELRDYGRILLTDEPEDIVNLLIDIGRKSYVYPPLDIVFLDKYMSLPQGFKPYSLTAIAQEKSRNLKKVLEGGGLSMFFIDKTFLNTSTASLNHYYKLLSKVSVPVNAPLKIQITTGRKRRKANGPDRLYISFHWNSRKNNILQDPPNMKVKFINIEGFYKNIWAEMFDLEAIKLELKARYPHRRGFKSEEKRNFRRISRRELRSFNFVKPNVEKVLVQVNYIELGGTVKNFCLEMKPVRGNTVKYLPLSDCVLSSKNYLK